jgi:hypothetical protein
VVAIVAAEDVILAAEDVAVTIEVAEMTADVGVMTAVAEMIAVTVAIEETVEDEIISVPAEAPAGDIDPTYCITYIQAFSSLAFNLQHAPVLPCT